MMVRTLLARGFVLAVTAAFAVSDSAAAPAPTATVALKLLPVQAGVEYDMPSPAADDAAACTIKAEKFGGATAWVVRSPLGTILRQFSDSNSDNMVDRWSYFQNGLEVYRDVDANFNGKADQYRWFHTAGSRWGLDKNEDGAIDQWQRISAEETAEEAVTALTTKDAKRFARLLVTQEEVAELGLPDASVAKVSERLTAAPKTFAQLAAGKIDAKAQFTDFGGLRPGMVPAGSNGITQDIVVYEDAWAMILIGDNHEQLQLGTMVNIGDAWKLVDGPELGADRAGRGFFYDAEGITDQAPSVAANEPTAEMQKILEAIETLDRQLATAPPDKKGPLCGRRADLIEKLAAAAGSPAERDQWLKQLADMLSAAVQDGTYPEGLDRLEELEQKLIDAKASESLLIQFQFRRMQAAYGLALAKPDAEYVKVQADWLEQLEAFVDKHKSSEHVAEALLQLAMASEFSGDNEAGEKWYRRLVDDFPSNPTSAKARGAIARLTCEGKPIAVKGASLQGGTVDLSRYRGKAVLVHYWSSSAPTSVSDHKELIEVYKKFGGAKFDILGVCLDSSREDVIAYLKANKLPWQQLFEPGGFDSRLANEMGIITAPLLILLDDKGQAVNANLQLTELEPELKKLLQARVAKK